MALVAAYAFDEGTGTTAAEASGGTTLTGVPGWAAGLHDDALRLNLVNGPAVDPFGSSGAFTIMFDVYIDGSGNGGYNLFIDGTIGEIGIIQQGSGLSLEWYPWFGPTGTTVATATWTHIAVVATGTARRVLVAGTQVATTSNTELSGTDPFTLGGESGFEPNIRIDNLRIYDEALDNTAIAALAGTAVTSGGTNYDKTPADSEGIADARTVVQENARTQADPVGLTDSVEATLGASVTREPADSVGLTDSITVVVTAERIQADSVGATDTATPAQDVVRTAADPVGIADTDNPLVLEFGETISDALGLTDSVTVVQTRVVTVADALGITDTATPTTDGDEVATPSDAVGLLDAATFTLDHVRTTADPVGLLDSATATTTIARAPADQLALTDSVVAVLEHVVTVADFIAATDSVSSFLGLVATPASRTTTVPAENRVIVVPAENRTMEA